MPRIRRAITDADILDMALSTSTARRLQGRWPEGDDRRRDTVVPAVRFLWGAFAVLVGALIASFVWNPFEGPKKHCGDRPNPAPRIECTKRGGDEAGGEVNDVGHGAQSGRKTGDRA